MAILRGRRGSVRVVCSLRLSLGLISGGLTIRATGSMARRPRSRGLLLILLLILLLLLRPVGGRLRGN